MKPTKRFRIGLGLVTLAAATLVVDCSGSGTPTNPVEEVPEPPRSTETFAGTFEQNGNSQHQFTVVATGNIEMTITSLEPVATLTVGLGVGNFDATADPPCFIFASDNRVVAGAVLLSSGQPPGEYCLCSANSTLKPW